MQTITKGCIVRRYALKQKMVVEDVDNYWAFCVWYEKGMIKTERIALDSLEVLRSNTRQTQIKNDDIVKLKSGSKRYKVKNINGDLVSLYGIVYERDSVIFRKPFLGLF